MPTRSGVPFALCCESYGLPRPVTEYPFALQEGRRWRFDYAWPSHHVALEVEGGIWQAGRHTRGAGFVKDLEKYNTAQCLGWVVLRCLPSTLAEAPTLAFVKRALAVREA
jgi:hypothetical protein